MDELHCQEIFLSSLDLRDHIAVDTIEPEWMLLITLAQSLAIRTRRRRVSLVRLTPYRHAAIVSKDLGPVASLPL
jgi:hypothetical protein